MDFIKITDGALDINDSDWGEERMIKGFKPLFEKNRFDKKLVSCGVNPSPDFGYFELADRFWRGSLAIYFSGVSGCFWESGAGYPEPWLFNARHSFELYLKGLLLYCVWFQELQNNVLAHGYRKHFRFSEFKEYFLKSHYLFEIYNNYQSRLDDVINKWDTKELPEAPEMNKMMLSMEGENILKEIDEADKLSFRFRYPSLKRDGADQLQELNWRYDDSQLSLQTGLPKNAGYFFDHITVINSLHKLRQEMNAIELYLSSSWDYIGGIQDIASDLNQEFFGEQF